MVGPSTWTHEVAPLGRHGK